MPFVEQVVTLPQYASQEHLWKYKELKCGVEPMTAIASELGSGKFSTKWNIEYDLGKVALLKELGRAAYHNPLSMVTGMREHQRAKFLSHTRRQRQMEHLATKEVELEKAGQDVVDAQIRDCPVCGTKSLIVYYDIRDEDYSFEENEGSLPQKERPYESGVRCTTCTFEINNYLGNPQSDYNLPFDDYWHTEELE